MKPVRVLILIGAPPRRLAPNPSSAAASRDRRPRPSPGTARSSRCISGRSARPDVGPHHGSGRLRVEPSISTSAPRTAACGSDQRRDDVRGAVQDQGLISSATSPSQSSPDSSGWAASPAPPEHQLERRRLQVDRRRQDLGEHGRRRRASSTARHRPAQQRHRPGRRDRRPVGPGEAQHLQDHGRQQDLKNRR